MPIEIEIGSLRSLLADEFGPRLRESVIHLQDGQVGWYRRLDRSDSVGVVASAQGLLTAAKVGHVDNGDLTRTVSTLLRSQRSDGSWPFISTLPDVGVVDSTSHVLIALAQARNSSEALFAVQRALGWLEVTALASGGWGITASEPFRVYSTCLALQAMRANQMTETLAYKGALKTLVSACDPNESLWRLSNGAASVSVSAFALYTLCSSQEASGYKKLLLAVASRIKEKVNNTSSTSSLVSGAWEVEEVEVTIGGIRRRIEYKYYSLALVCRALANLEEKGSPELIVCLSRLMRICSDRQVETSWELHDLTMAFTDFLNRLDPLIDCLWLKGKNVLTHKTGEGKFIRFFRRHHSEFIWSGCALVAAAVLLQKGDMRAAFTLKEGFFLAGTILVSVYANYLTTKFFKL